MSLRREVEVVMVVDVLDVTKNSLGCLKKKHEVEVEREWERIQILIVRKKESRKKIISI